ncbi:hypothetical protein CRENBAI_026890 [Crenichthys baileyi]|uniref:Uncharacterized protein n=1 Tax=Crenichthys baileyi TaxID=28760 RepID=A0AAV9R8K9_9TELE
MELTVQMDGPMLSTEENGGGGECGGVYHAFDLAAASHGHISFISTPLQLFLSLLLLLLPFFSLCSSSSSAQKWITKGIVGGRQMNERARQRVRWCGSLHFAWRSPERSQRHLSDWGIAG